MNPRLHKFISMRMLRVLGGLVLLAVLVSGLVSGHQNRSPTSTQQHHTTVVTLPTVAPTATPYISQAQLERDFTVDTVSQAPDGHAVLELVVSRTTPTDRGVVVSLDHGSTWQLVADQVDAVEWAPYTDVLLFAVLRKNVALAPDAHGNRLPEYAALYQITDAGKLRKAAEAETIANALTFDYGGDIGIQQMSWWERKGDMVTYELDEPVGGTMPDGTDWEGSMPAVQLQVQLPPASKQ